MTIEDILASNDPWKVASQTFLRLISKVAETPEACSEAEWMVFRVWSLLGEVSNGGFDQFFFNSSGNHAVATPDALRAIGDDQALPVLQEAMAVFPEGVSPDRDIRWAQMDNLSKEEKGKWGALDRKVWECSPRVIERLAVYIRAHASEIGR